MSEKKTFNKYNFVTGAVDGTMAYDFSTPMVYPEEEEEVYKSPGKRNKHREENWIREDIKEEASAAVQAVRRSGLRIIPFLAAVCVVILAVMILLTQIQLVSISNNSVVLEAQIEELKTERDKLTVEYETVFNLKDVEEYATNVLGMQEPRSDQVHYLSNISAADKAVVITNDQDTSGFVPLLQDLISSFKAYFN